MTDADLRNVKILNADLEECDLRNAQFTHDEIDWTLTKNWRKSKLDAELERRLIGRFGPEQSGTRVIMLAWEFPPFAWGGGWTAAYHLTRRLRRKGADVTMVVPWPQTALSPYVLGHEIEVIGIGIKHPEIDLAPFFGAFRLWITGRCRGGTCEGVR